MPLVRVSVPPSDPGWLFELKYDGFRAVAYVENGECRLVSRRNHIYKGFSLLRENISRLAVRDAVLDGEIVCLDDEGRSQFKTLLFKRGEPVFAVFDILWLNGVDVRPKPLRRRKHLLAEVIPSTGQRLLRVDHVEGQGVELFELACARDLEGVVGKWAAGVYGSDGRTTSWVKVKNSSYSQAEGRGELFEGRGSGKRLAAPQLVLHH
jgi:bifunctional non-homologous end joining protein LigD